MSGFQSEVRLQQTTGIVGEFAEITGAERAFSAITQSADASSNVFGRAFTHVAGEDDSVQAGGSGVFAGILVNPKEHVLLGTADGTLEASLIIPNNIGATFSDMGIIYVELDAGASIGQSIGYRTTTDATAGELVVVANPEALPADVALVPNTKAVRNNTTTAGQAIIQLTN